MKRDDFDIADEFLWEWAHFFRDRRYLERCRSIEHRFQPHSEDFAKEGWGDQEAAPSQTKKSYLMARALRTHDAVMQLPREQKWAITYRYCYPALHKNLVLRLMKKWTGRRLNWKTYEETLEIGRFRVYAWIKNG